MIAERLAKVEQSYSGKESGLEDMVRVRDAKLEEAGDLHRYYIHPIKVESTSGFRI